MRNRSAILFILNYVNKIRIKHIYFIVFVFFVVVSNPDVMAQYSYFGRTSDLVSEAPVGNVSIYNKRLGTAFISKNNGAFVLDYSNSRKETKYQIAFNMFFAPSDENVSLQLFTSDGKRILQTGYLGIGGSYLLPSLNQGIYILSITSEGNSDVIKIFSNGKNLSCLQNLAEKADSDPDERDTLIFSKEGYYNVEMILPRADTVIHVKLLSESKNDLNFLNGLPEYKAFNLLQSSPFVTNHGDVESVKFIYNRNDGQIYYMNSKRYEFHYDFAVRFLKYNKGLYHFNTIQYSGSKERYLF